MKNNEQLQVLVNSLANQISECEKTMEKISQLVKENNESQLTFYALTEIQTPHFGLNGISSKVEKLQSYLKKKKKEKE